MSKRSAVPKGTTFTFRLDPALKRALAASASALHKRLGELMRELVREHLTRTNRAAFEAEARRQCEILTSSPPSRFARRESGKEGDSFLPTPRTENGDRFAD